MKRIMLIITVCCLFLYSACCASTAENDGSFPEASVDLIEKDIENTILRIPLSAMALTATPTESIVSIPYQKIPNILKSFTIDQEAQIIFYREQDDRIYAAYGTDSRDFVVFFEAGTYESGYDIKSYENVLGHDGFVLIAPLGAGYVAYDYYYFDENGTLNLLAQCSNYVIENDFNRDGIKELLWFYHGYPTDQVGACMAFYGFLKDGEPFYSDLNKSLTAYFSDDEMIIKYYCDNAQQASVNVFYQLSSDDEINGQRMTISFVDDMIGTNDDCIYLLGCPNRAFEPSGISAPSDTAALLPPATAEMFGLDEVDSALFYGALMNDLPYSSGRGITFPYVGVYGSYDDEVGRNYICFVAYKRYDVDDASRTLTFAGTLMTYGRAILVQDSSGKYSCESFDLLGDGEGWSKDLRDFCGPLTDLPSAIMDGSIDYVSTFPDEMSKQYCDLVNAKVKE